MNQYKAFVLKTTVLLINFIFIFSFSINFNSYAFTIDELEQKVAAAKANQAQAEADLEQAQTELFKANENNESGLVNVKAQAVADATVNLAEAVVMNAELTEKLNDAMYEGDTLKPSGASVTDTVTATASADSKPEPQTFRKSGATNTDGGNVIRADSEITDNALGSEVGGTNNIDGRNIIPAEGGVSPVATTTDPVITEIVVTGQSKVGGLKDAAEILGQGFEDTKDAEMRIAVGGPQAQKEFEDMIAGKGTKTEFQTGSDSLVEGSVHGMGIRPNPTTSTVKTPGLGSPMISPNFVDTGDQITGGAGSDRVVITDPLPDFQANVNNDPNLIEVTFNEDIVVQTPADSAVAANMASVAAEELEFQLGYVEDRVIVLREKFAEAEKTENSFLVSGLTVQLVEAETKEIELKEKIDKLRKTAASASTTSLDVGYPYLDEESRFGGGIGYDETFDQDGDKKSDHWEKSVGFLGIDLRADYKHDTGFSVDYSFVNQDLDAITNGDTQHWEFDVNERFGGGIGFNYAVDEGLNVKYTLPLNLAYVSGVDIGARIEKAVLFGQFTALSTVIDNTGAADKGLAINGAINFAALLNCFEATSVGGSASTSGLNFVTGSLFGAYANGNSDSNSFGFSSSDASGDASQINGYISDFSSGSISAQVAINNINSLAGTEIIASEECA